MKAVLLSAILSCSFDVDDQADKHLCRTHYRMRQDPPRSEIEGRSRLTFCYISISCCRTSSESINCVKSCRLWSRGDGERRCPSCRRLSSMLKTCLARYVGHKIRFGLGTFRVGLGLGLGAQASPAVPISWHAIWRQVVRCGGESID